TFNPAKVNSLSHAVGLIQFTAPVARELGTTRAELAAMSATEQLTYVEKYFRLQEHRHGRIRTLEDTYMAILAPRAIHKPNDTVLFVQGSKAYRQNRGLDSNHDGLITKREAAAKVRSALKAGLKCKGDQSVNFQGSFSGTVVDLGYSGCPG